MGLWRRGTVGEEGKGTVVDAERLEAGEIGISALLLNI